MRLASPLSSAATRPPVPALRSYWLALHVGFTFLGEGFLAVAFASSLLFLVLERRARRPTWIAVIGFLLALFTFAGVNYLIRGLHSYG